MQSTLRVQNLVGKGKVRRGEQILCQVEYDLTISRWIHGQARVDEPTDKPDPLTISGDIYTGGVILPPGVPLELELQEGRKVSFTSRGSRASFLGEFR